MNHAPHTVPPSWRFLLIAAGVAAVSYVAAMAWAGLDEVTAAVRRVGAGGLAVAIALSLVNYALRLIRWQLYLDALGHPVPWQSSTGIYLAGFAWTVTPAKIGEALRGVLYARHGVPLRSSTAAFLSERLSDLAAIVALSVLGVGLHPDGDIIVAAGLLAIVAGWYLLSQPAAAAWVRRFAIRATGKIQTMLERAAAVLDAARLCHRPRRVAVSLAIGLAAWWAEALALYLVLIWMGADATLLTATFAYAAAVLAGALSFLPGGLGTTEAAMIGILIWRGVPSDIAVASTILIRLTTLWFAVLLGFACLSFRPARAVA